MPAPLVEQYERILQADPRSLVFVQLAGALVEQGDALRAVEVCRHGLVHHPRSIQGHVMLGRALLAAGDAPEGLAALRDAAAVEPDSPYGWSLASEAAAAHGFTPRELLAARPYEGPPPEPSREPPTEPSTEPPLAPHEASMEPAEEAATAIAPEFFAGPSLETEAGAGIGPAVDAGVDAAPPPTLPRRAPPPLATERPPPSLLGDLPSPPASGAPWTPSPGAEHSEAPAPASAPAPDIDELAAAYERELRARAQAEPPPPEPRRRHVLLAALATVLAIAAAVGAGTYVASRRAHRTEDARTIAEGARRGILRDTAGSLREASRALAEARSLDGTDPVVRSLSALAAALRASDFDDASARAEAERWLASGEAGDVAAAVRFLLAPPEERARVASAAGEHVASAPVVSDAIAGEARAAAGDPAGAASHLEAAARAVPPSLRALSRLGDAALARGEPEVAIAWLSAALAAHPTHPGAAIRLAEANLALHRDIPASLASLRAVEADPESPPVAADQVRFELAYAHLLAAEGQRGAAADRLSAAASRAGAPPAILLGLAEVHLAGGSCAEAEGAARRALQSGGALPARILVARAQLCAGKREALIAETAGVEAREIRIVRADARLAGGDPRGAIAELEPLGREGRMPTDAAARHAMALVRLDRRAQARAVVERLLAAPRPAPMSLVAAAELSRLAGRRGEAEERYRSALEADPDLLEAHCGLGRLLLEEGRTVEGVNELTRAVTLSPGHAEASQALARARGAGAAAPSTAPSADQRRQRPASTKLK